MLVLQLTGFKNVSRLQTSLFRIVNFSIDNFQMSSTRRTSRASGEEIGGGSMSRPTKRAKVEKTREIGASKLSLILISEFVHVFSNI
jgi:hypothetical protein